MKVCIILTGLQFTIDKLECIPDCEDMSLRGVMTSEEASIAPRDVAVILCGDLNSRPQTAAIEFLER
jgi:endonuclease/exonuclease/phosphatase family metal-dependent hydrolase